MESLLKIVYQNGEFVSDGSKILGVSIDTIFTVFTTIIIFIAGYIFNKRIENDKERKRLREVKQYFEQLVELLERPVIKQRDEFTAFSHKLNEKKEQHLSFSDITIAEINLIKQVDPKDLFNIYLKGKSGSDKENPKQFGMLISKIDHIIEIKKFMMPSFKDFMNRVEEYEKEYKDNVKITSELFDEMVQAHHDGVPVTDQFLVGLDGIRVAWVALGQNGVNFLDMYVARVHYLKPVRTLCQVFIADRRAVIMLRHIQSCILALDNMDEVKYVYRRYFLMDARSIQKCMIEIKHSIQYLNQNP
jgi:hypothetical protein